MNLNTKIAFESHIHFDSFFMSVLDSSILGGIGTLSENPLSIYRGRVSGLRIVNAKGELVSGLNKDFCDCAC